MVLRRRGNPRPQRSCDAAQRSHPPLLLKAATREALWRAMCFAGSFPLWQRLPLSWSNGTLPLTDILLKVFLLQVSGITGSVEYLAIHA
jgi:hypothetical protein